MKPALESNDRQFLDRLRRLGSASVQSLCEDLGVTATAVRQRLSRLQAMGFVDRHAVKSGRGRPHHTYRLSEAGLRELGDNYGDLAVILWRAVQNIEDPALRNGLMDRLQHALVERYGNRVRGESVRERLRELIGTMTENGFDVEIDESGPLPVLKENSCPYYELAHEDAGICQLEQDVFRTVLGADVTLTHRSLDGHCCCEFEVAPDKTEVNAGVD